MLRSAATQGERALSIVRAFFCTAELTRYLLISEGGTAQELWLSLGPPLLAVAFSLYIFAASRRGPLASPLLYVSVALDWALGSVALLSNVLAPWPAYNGIVSTPDIAVIYLIIVVAALRLSPSAVLLSGCLNGASSVILFLLDYRIGLAGQNLNLNALSFVLLLCLSASIIAFVFTVWARKLVQFGATETWRRTYARRTLDALMEETHGIRSLLSAVQLSSDRLLEAAPSMPKTAQRVTWQLHDSVTELVHLAVQSRERSIAAIASLRGLRTVDLLGVVDGVTRLLQRQFPDVVFHTSGDSGDGKIGVVGGNPAFERIVLNVLTNACEGNGTRGANRVWVTFHPLREGLKLVVRDDGPGFSTQLLDGAVRCMTTKAGGTGIGLFLVSRLMRESGGSLKCENSSMGGALVSLTFPTFDQRLMDLVPPSSRRVESIGVLI